MTAAGGVGTLDTTYIEVPATLRGDPREAGRLLVRAPGVLSVSASALEEMVPAEVEVREEFARRHRNRVRDGRVMPARQYRVRPGPDPGLAAGPRSLDGAPVHEARVASMAQEALTGDERATLRGDVAKLALLACASSGAMRLDDRQGALLIGGSNSAANRQRARDAARVGGGLIVISRVHPPLELMGTRLHEGGFDLWGPHWWKGGEGTRGQAWRLSGALTRPVRMGEGGARGVPAGYWGGLHRTVSGLEAALTWWSGPGDGKRAKMPPALRAVGRRGPGPWFFVPWHAVLRCAGERVEEEAVETGKGTEARRYRRRVHALNECGYAAGAQEDGGEGTHESLAGDTVEIRRMKGRRGHPGGVMVRASARFCAAYARSRRTGEWVWRPVRMLVPW